MTAISAGGIIYKDTRVKEAIQMGNSEKLRVAVIGAGHLGSIHARIYSRLDKVQLVGVCDIKRKKARKIAHKYRSSTFTNHKDLLEKVDAVSIAVPTSSHYEIAKDFLTHKIHVLVEKPITRTLKEAEEILKLAKRHRLILQVGHIERFNAAVKALEKLKSEPRFIECHRLSPYQKRGLDVGVVLDLMIHDIDIILSIVKSKIKTIAATGVSVLSEHEDIANARIVFENGEVSNITASRVAGEPMRKIRIFYHDAYVSLDYKKQTVSIFRKSNGKISRERIKIKKREPLKAEIKAFVKSVLTKEKPLVSGQEAKDALEVALSIARRCKRQGGNSNESHKSQVTNHK